MTDIFSSAESYKNIFNEGLGRLARDESLGAFILAMANATFDERIYSELKDVLRVHFLQLDEKYTASFSQGEKINEVDEDLLVFLKMICVGFDGLQVTEFRNAAKWELQFNHVRGFRPTRISQQKVDNLRQDFSATEFNFNTPFLAKERLWEGQYGNSHLSLFYNKYPFAHYHTLLVPEREKKLPQFLELSQHTMMWQFLESVGKNVNGIGAGYNSRGAFSSVNHLHFQLFIRDEELPITSDNWQHNGGGLSNILVNVMFLMISTKVCNLLKNCISTVRLIIWFITPAECIVCLEECRAAINMQNGRLDFHGMNLLAGY